MVLHLAGEKMRRRAIALAVILGILLGAMAIKGNVLALPEVRKSPEPSAFDTRRALERLDRILGDERPHPVDSAANDAVRTRLIQELRAIGLAPVVTNRFACSGSSGSRTVSCARVRNVIANLGSTGENRLLLASHYDSTPVGPGAADDGIGLAVMLETASILAREKPRRPVTFLFDEGEEAGLLGARAFLDGDPLAAEVTALLNFEARGVTGPAMMYETSHPNGAAIAHFERAAIRPFANSLATDFARMIPNTTDVELFKARGWTILNFAIIGNETRYHSGGDTLSALDPRSVQHMGDQALALARDFTATGNGDAHGPTAYADWLGRGFVAMPLAVSLAGVALLLAWATALSWRRRYGLAPPAAAIVATLAGAAALSFAAQGLVGLARPGEFWRAFPAAISLAVTVSALGAGLIALPGRDVDRLRRAFWLIFLALGAGISIIAPGGSIFFLAPPLVALTGIALEGRLRGAARAGTVLATVLLFLSWAPLLALAEILLGFDAAWMFAPAAALILLPALVELTPMMASLPQRTLAACALMAVLGAWTVTALLPAYSADRKQPFGIEHVWDENADSARWMVVNDGAPLPTALTAGRAFEHGVKVPWSGRPRWAAPAPGRSTPPSVQRLAKKDVANGRRVSLRVRGNGAETWLLRVPSSAGLRAVRIGGATQAFGAPESSAPYILRCQGRRCDDIVVDLLIGAGAPVTGTIIGIRSGLPASARPLLDARPAFAAPQYNPDATIALGQVSF